MGALLGDVSAEIRTVPRLPLQAHAVHLPDPIQHSCRNEWEVGHGFHDGCSFLIHFLELVLMSNQGLLLQ